MPLRWQSFPKLIAIIAGFLILIGIVLLGVAFLAFFGFLNVGVLLEGNHLVMFAVAMVVVGLLDTFVAIIIARW